LESISEALEGISEALGNDYKNLLLQYFC